MREKDVAAVLGVLCALLVLGCERESAAPVMATQPVDAADTYSIAAVESAGFLFDGGTRLLRVVTATGEAKTLWVTHYEPFGRVNVFAWQAGDDEIEVTEVPFGTPAEERLVRELTAALLREFDDKQDVATQIRAAMEGDDVRRRPIAALVWSLERIHLERQVRASPTQFTERERLRSRMLEAAKRNDYETLNAHWEQWAQIWDRARRDSGIYKEGERQIEALLKPMK